YWALVRSNHLSDPQSECRAMTWPSCCHLRFGNSEAVQVAVAESDLAFGPGEEKCQHLLSRFAPDKTGGLDRIIDLHHSHGAQPDSAAEAPACCCRGALCLVGDGAGLLCGGEQFFRCGALGEVVGLRCPQGCFSG